MKPKELRALQDAAERIAQNAGALLLKAASTPFKTREKVRFDLVTSADLASNKLIRAQLLKAWPSSMVLAEEDEVSIKSFMKSVDDCEVVWIADPLDGTTNFSKRVPHYGVSIAAYHPGTAEVLAGCVYDPSRGECFSAAKGLGAKLNGKLIAVSKVDSLHFSLAATGFSYSQREGPDNNLSELEPFVKKCLGVRRFGAASLDLAWIACGRFDIYWEPGLKPWDVAAGILIVREAGGLVSNYDATPSTPFDNQIIATNAQMHEIALKRIRKARRKVGLK